MWLAGRVKYFKKLHGFTDASGFSHRDMEAGATQNAGAQSAGTLDARDEEAQYPAGLIPGPEEETAVRTRPSQAPAQPMLF